MNDYRGQCVACDGEVRGACVREVSRCWESERRGGGAHAVQGPGKAYSGRVMHTHCHETALMRERSGLIGQETML